jgi:hypothetical protein
MQENDHPRQNVSMYATSAAPVTQPGEGICTTITVSAGDTLPPPHLEFTVARCTGCKNVGVPTSLPPPSVAPNKHRTRLVIYTRGGVDATIEDWSVSKKSALERIAKCLEMDTVSNKISTSGH